MFFRIYVTDADGFQKTANYIYTKDAWRQDLTVKGKKTGVGDHTLLKMSFE